MIRTSALLVPTFAVALSWSSNAHAQTESGKSTVQEDASPATNSIRSAPEMSSSDVELKVRRLRITGWSFVVSGAGTFAWFLAWPSLREDSPSEAKGTRYFITDITLPVISAGLLTIGGALLLRARLVLRRHEEDKETAVSVGLAGTGARLRVRF